MLCYKININYHPDYSMPPNWKIMTKEEYCKEFGANDDDWEDMMDTNAVLPTWQLTCTINGETAFALYDDDNVALTCNEDAVPLLKKILKEAYNFVQNMPDKSPWYNFFKKASKE